MASKGDEYETAMNTPEGSRVIELIKAREKEKKEIERKKLEIKNESKRLINNIKEKFGGGSADFFDDQFRNQTVGLVTSDEFKRRKLQAKTGVTLSDQPQQNQKETEEKMGKEEEKKVTCRKMKVRKKELLHNRLSFIGEEDLEEDIEQLEPVKKKKNFGKNPDVDTQFLPDKERDQEQIKQREHLISAYLQQQNAIKEDKLKIYFSLFDGSNIIKEVTVKRKITINRLIQKCKLILAQDFKYLSNIPSDGFVFLKENKIFLPEQTLHDLIIANPKEKNGNDLFQFEKTEIDGKTICIDKESKYGISAKMLDKKSFERNKHLYPYNLWTTYKDI